jgi:hypothetical protein
LERAAREPGEEPLLLPVERFVGHFLLELAVHHTDVDAKLIRAVCARVASEIAYWRCVRHEVWNLDVKVLTKEPEQNLVMEPHRPRIVAKGREDKVVFRHDDQNCHSAGRCS